MWFERDQDSQGLLLMLETTLGTILLCSYGVTWLYISRESNGENWLLVLILAWLGGCPYLSTEKERRKEEEGREREHPGLP